MKKIATLTAVLLAFSAVAAFAQYYARGGYYDAGWSADAGNLMVEGPAGVFTAAVASPMVAGYYEGKVAVSDWSSSWPNSNQPVHLAADFETVHWTLDTNAHGDGWLPDSYIAYNDHMVPAGWTFEVIGSAAETGGWASGVAAALNGDVWSVTIPIASPGTYDVKFRHTGDWSHNVGSDGYGTNSNNYQYTTSVPNEPVTFQFNQVTGRMRCQNGGATATKTSTFGALKAQYK
jgi:hypothetical protein